MNEAVQRDLPRIEKGVLDLRNLDFQKSGPIQLNGEWEFYWNELISFPNCNDDVTCPEEGNLQREIKTNTTFITVPGQWQNHKPSGRDEYLPARGYASYRLKILLPPDVPPLSMEMNGGATSFEMFINGKPVSKNGRVGKSASEAEPFYQVITFPLHLRNTEILDVIVHVSNFHYHKAGLWDPITLGITEDITELSNTRKTIDIIVATTLLIMGIYHLGLFLNRRKDRSALYFSLFCLILTLRTISVNERMILDLIPGIPFFIIHKLEYLSFYYGSFVFIKFFRSLFPDEFSDRWFKIFIIAYLPPIFAVILLPMNLYGWTLNPVQFIVLSSILYILVTNVRASLHGKQGANLFLTGLILFFSSVLNDILYGEGLLNSGYLASYGFLIFVISQAIVLSGKFAGAFRDVEMLSERQIAVNEASARFVPTEFLTLLNKKDITQLHLGDQIQMEMTILFSDIRSFSSMSELMTPEENFSFLNSFLKQMEPIIHAGDGFIDKYIGDAIMALFPRNPEDALDSAIEMQSMLVRYNSVREKTGSSEIRIGVGIHTGSCMLGIIGSEDRMESTVISDAVNLASTIEQLTKEYGARIIISEEVLHKIQNIHKYNYRILDRVLVKGKKKAATLYEIYDGMSLEEMRPFLETKSMYEHALASYKDKKFDMARNMFQKVYQKNPGDRAARLFIRRCDAAIRHGVESDWKGVFEYH